MWSSIQEELSVIRASVTVTYAPSEWLQQGQEHHYRSERQQQHNHCLPGECYCQPGQVGTVALPIPAWPSQDRVLSILLTSFVVDQHWTVYPNASKIILKCFHNSVSQSLSLKVKNRNACARSVMQQKQNVLTITESSHGWNWSTNV